MYKIKFAANLMLFVYLIAAVSCSGNSAKTEKAESQMEASLIEVSIGGMTCTGCEQTIQKTISNLEGVKSVKASFTTGIAVVEYFPSKTDTMKMKEAVSGTGYTVKKFTAPLPQ